MPEINIDIIVAGFIASLPALIANLYGIMKTRADARREDKTTNATVKKVDTEATDALADTALSLVVPLREENVRLVKRNRYLERGVKVLIRQLQRADIEPCFDPNNGNGDGEINIPTEPLPPQTPQTPPKKK